MRLPVFIRVIRINLTMLVLVGLVMLSALAVIYTKHQTRSQFVELQRQENQRDRLNEEWGRLLLELSTWTTPGRVEQQARQQLEMGLPNARNTVVYRP